MRFDQPADNRLEPVSCAWAQPRLYDYLEAELPLTERLQTQAHLDSCADCRLELAQIRRAEAALSSASKAIPAPGDMRSEFYARLASESHSARRIWSGWRIAAPALACGAVAVVLLRSGTLSPNAPPLPNRTNLSNSAPALAKATETPAQREAEDEAPQMALLDLSLDRIGDASKLSEMPAEARRALLRPAPERETRRDIERPKPSSVSSSTPAVAYWRERSFALKTENRALFDRVASVAESDRRSRFLEKAQGAEKRDALINGTFDLAHAAPDKKKESGERGAFLMKERYAEATELASAEAEETHIEIEDDVRGFSERTRLIVGNMETDENGAILSLDSEEAEAPDSQ